MRTVTGPAEHVVIVGAGLGGLSAALRLTGAGRRVTVLEREDSPGGRAGSLRLGGYRFDTGPTVLTMPELIADAFDSVGEDLDRWLTLRRLDPMYRARFADGSVLDVRADPADTEQGVRDLCGPAEAAGFRRFTDFATRMFRAEMRDFIDAQVDSPLALLRPSLARVAALGGFRRLDTVVGRYLRDPRTRRLFSFQAMYAGLDPHRALALYAVISYMDSVAGVYHVDGGPHAVATAMADAAARHGAVFRYGSEVSRVEVRGGRAVAVHTADGERVPADVVILNPDLPVAYRDLLPPSVAPARLARLRFSPSCFLLLAGARVAHPEATHHTIHFGQAWRRTFEEIISRGELMSDPSFLVSTASVTEPAAAPAGAHSYYVLFPTPNLTAPLDWSVLGPRYRDEVVAVLERAGYADFGSAVEVEQITTPADWRSRGMAAGAPFAAAHTFSQTGPFRPGNLAPGLDNVIFTGSGTRPGVGVPMVLISGRLAAERVLGRDRGYRTRALVDIP
ncbi:phytoene desaturase family protein [Parafrankia sp. EUN1f]|uniref:phytoene desaturase family protein n=1 Tax=Parafrankia sp. EUN1f TaxID=102897 RepID=UPI0001C44334|nr:phytoene desaturase family protein [Parafrankia sp. EUN1f]EFC83798.1 phytoene desaturase [Parafrankia sp. EUN1f]